MISKFHRTQFCAFSLAAICQPVGGVGGVGSVTKLVIIGLREAR